MPPSTCYIPVPFIRPLPPALLFSCVLGWSSTSDRHHNWQQHNSQAVFDVRSYRSSPSTTPTAPTPWLSCPAPQALVRIFRRPSKCAVSPCRQRVSLLPFPRTSFRTLNPKQRFQDPSFPVFVPILHFRKKGTLRVGSICQRRIQFLTRPLRRGSNNIRFDLTDSSPQREVTTSPTP